MDKIPFFFGIVGVAVFAYFSAFVILKVLSILEIFFEDDVLRIFKNQSPSTVERISIPFNHDETKKLIKSIESLNNNPEAQKEYIQKCLEIRKSYESSINLDK
jgi:hypothetical protein